MNAIEKELKNFEHITFAEYIWIGGSKSDIRSKTKVLDGKNYEKPEDFPEWNFDGSSTNQAVGTDSEVELKPVAVYKDPFRGMHHKLVLCETINDDIAFKLSFQGYDDTIGNIIQSHISMNMISDESILATCGYKKRHPLQEVIDFYLSLNPNNKIFESSNEQKIIAILQTFQEACGTLIPIFSTIKKEAIDNL